MAGRKSRVDKEALRQTIIETSFRLFKERGIRAVHMNDIAEELSISKRTIYEVFSDKEQLLSEGYELYRQRQLDECKGFEAEENGIELLYRILVQELESLKQIHPNFFIDLRRYPRLLTAFERIDPQLLETATAYFKHGVTDGYFRKDVDIKMFIHLLNWQKAMFVHSDLTNIFLPSALFKEMFLIHIRGIATAKGQELLDELLQKDAKS